MRTNRLSRASRGTPGAPGAFALAALALLLITHGVAADRLELRNGDVITGTIQLMDAEQVIIQTEYGLLEVERAAVLRGEFGVTGTEVIDSLIFLFEFDTTLDDAIGGHLATNNGLRYVADRNGSPASALRSDGNGTYLSIAQTSELNALNQFTLFFWIQVEDLSSTQYLFSKWDRTQGSTADGKFTVRTSGGNLTAYFVDPAGGYHWLTASSVLQPLTWHAVAVSFTGGRASIYVDGESVRSERFDFTELLTNDSPMLVMTAESQTEDRFTYYNAVGTIDGLRLYSRALSPDEVASLSVESGSD